MKYRSRTEISAQILTACTDDGMTKTRLMYTSFVSFNQLKEYLAFLEENGLLTYDAKDTKYRCTQKGHQFIDIHDRLDELSGFATIDSIRERRLSKLL